MKSSAMPIAIKANGEPLVTGENASSSAGCSSSRQKSCRRASCAWIDNARANASAISPRKSWYFHASLRRLHHFFTGFTQLLLLYLDNARAAEPGWLDLISHIAIINISTCRSASLTMRCDCVKPRILMNANHRTEASLFHRRPEILRPSSSALRSFTTAASDIIV